MAARTGITAKLYSSSDGTTFTEIANVYEVSPGKEEFGLIDDNALGQVAVKGYVVEGLKTMPKLTAMVQYTAAIYTSLRGHLGDVTMTYRFEFNNVAVGTGRQQVTFGGCMTGCDPQKLVWNETQKIQIEIQPLTDYTVSLSS